MPEQDGARAGQLDRKRGDDQQGRQRDCRGGCDDDVEDAFDDAVAELERSPRNDDGRLPVKFVHPRRGEAQQFRYDDFATGRQRFQRDRPFRHPLHRAGDDHPFRHADGSGQARGHVGIMPFGMQVGGVGVDHLHMRAGFNFDTIHDDRRQMRHFAQQARAQTADGDTDERDAERRKSKPGDEGQPRKLFGDLAQIDDQQHEQRGLRQRQKPPENPPADIGQHVNAIGPALHRQQDVQRRNHREHDQPVRLARFAHERAERQAIGKQE